MKNFQVFFTKLVKTTSVFREQFSARLSKLLSTCPDEQFEEKTYFSKKSIVQIYSNFGEQLTAVITKLLFMCPDAVFGHIVTFLSSFTFFFAVFWQ